MATATVASLKSSAVSHRIPALDGWRGIAILLVLVSHGWLSQRVNLRIVGLGVHGVAVFFVLSGFLITRQLMIEEDCRGSISLRAFYVRRVFRILPCSWTFLAALIIITGGTIVKNYSHDLLACVLFFRNYVDPRGLDIVTSHFWSLSIEEQFYFVWPALLVLLGRKRAVWLALLGACMVAFMRWSHRATLYSLPAMATYQTQYRADGLLLGCCAALIYPAVASHVKRWMIPPLLAALAVCIFGNHWLTPLYENAIIAALMIATTAQPTGWVSTVLSNAVMKWIGRLSYSAYVWQQLFLAIRPNLAAYILLVPLVAAASFFLIEEPIRKVGKRLSECLQSSSPLKVPS